MNNKTNHTRCLAVLLALTMTACTETCSLTSADGEHTPITVSQINTQTSDTRTGSFTDADTRIWGTDETVTINYTDDSGIPPNSSIFSATNTDGTITWKYMAGTCYHEDIHDALNSNIRYTVSSWGGSLLADLPADAHTQTAPYLITDQSNQESGYRQADYMTSDPQPFPATVTTPLSATLLHRTVELRITITRGNTGWFSSSANDEEKEAANSAFLALFSTGDVPTEAIHIATTSDPNDPSKLDYNVRPCLYSTNSGTASTAATVTLHARIPVSLLPGSDGKASTPLFQLTDGATLATATYTRPTGVVAGKALEIAITYNRHQPMNTLTATLKGWTSKPEIPLKPSIPTTKAASVAVKQN